MSLPLCVLYMCVYVCVWCFALYVCVPFLFGIRKKTSKLHRYCLKVYECEAKASTAVTLLSLSLCLFHACMHACARVHARMHTHTHTHTHTAHASLPRCDSTPVPSSCQRLDVNCSMTRCTEPLVCLTSFPQHLLRALLRHRALHDAQGSWVLHNVCRVFLGY